MKKFITLMIVFAGFVFTTHAQEVIQLEEAELTFTPTATVLEADYSSGVIVIKEKHAAQFQSDAIRFLKENFDINRFLRESGKDTDHVNVMLKSKSGILTAKYDKNGDLVKTFQKFKDIPLPSEIRNQVYANYEGWTMTKNKYVAYGMEDQLDTEKYLVHLERGKDKEKIKITPSQVSGVAALIEKQ